MSCREKPSIFHRYLLVCVVLAVSGCAVQPPVPGPDRLRAFASHQSALSSLTSWSLAGRISVRLENNAWSASLYWQQTRDSYRLRVVAPLSRGSVEINGDAGEVSLTSTEGEVYRGTDVDRLMQGQLGWSVPLSALEYWIKGLPEPGVDAERIELDEGGRLTGLVQADWKVNYEAYRRSGDYQLPFRLQLSREGLTLRISVNSWNTDND